MIRFSFEGTLPAVSRNRRLSNPVKYNCQIFGARRLIVQQANSMTSGTARTTTYKDRTTTNSMTTGKANTTTDTDRTIRDRTNSMTTGRARDTNRTTTERTTTDRTMMNTIMTMEVKMVGEETMSSSKTRRTRAILVMTVDIMVWPWPEDDYY